nr:YhjD/YihY/BrkB family envelope integrity protein [Burkholderiales bacterium]
SVFGDYLVYHFDYDSIDIPVLGDMLKHFFRMIGMLSSFAGIWFVVFLLYFQVPLKRPALSQAILYSFLCTLSLYALEGVLIHVVKIDYYIGFYGSLGDIIFVLIWVYLACILFFVWAQFLNVAGKIDVIALEKIFLAGEQRSRMEHRMEHVLFDRSSRIFEKYGRKCSRGDVIIRQNDDEGTIYYLYSGQVGLYRTNRDRELRMGGLRTGEIFGEMAYLLGERRAATVIAESDCFLFILSPETLEALLGYSTKLSRRIIESLCQRIAKMNRGILSSGFASDTYKHPVFNPDAGAV